jgi:hypothetical protein
MRRQIEDNGDGTISIPLTLGQKALIDAEDLPLVAPFQWFAKRCRNTYYAARNLPRRDNGTRPQVKMHRAILGVSDDAVVDHRDGNGLDNRRQNLRHATHSQNAANARRRADNTSGHAGVSWSRTDGKWLVRLGNGGRFYVGLFTDKKDAVAAYEEAARKRYGEYSRSASRGKRVQP